VTIEETDVVSRQISSMLFTVGLKTFKQNTTSVTSNLKVSVKCLSW
jgi:hypothetical protein